MSEIINENKEYVIVDKESFVTIADAARAAMGTEEEYSISELAEAIAGSVLPPPAVEDAGKVATVNEEGKWEMQEAESGLPANPGAYKYMATDGEGNWVAADRECYSKGIQLVDIVKDAEIVSNETFIEVLRPFEIGTEYVVVWNGTEYICVSVAFDDSLFIGNPSILSSDLPETEEPFALILVPMEGIVVYHNTEGATNTITILEKTESVKKLDRKFLEKASEEKEGIVSLGTMNGLISLNESNKIVGLFRGDAIGTKFNNLPYNKTVFPEVCFFDASFNTAMRIMFNAKFSLTDSGMTYSFYGVVRDGDNRHNIGDIAFKKVTLNFEGVKEEAIYTGYTLE